MVETTSALADFHTRPRQSLRFNHKVGLEPTAYSPKWNCATTALLNATYRDVLPLLRNFLLENLIQHTTCLSPCELPDRASRKRCIFTRRSPETDGTKTQLLPATVRTVSLPFLVPDNKLVSLRDQVPPWFFDKLVFPPVKKALELAFFLRTCVSVSSRALFPETILANPRRLA